MVEFIFLALWMLACDNNSPAPVDEVVANTKPNVVIILTDDQGWADIGYNNPDVYSPHLDRLAKNGVVFKQSYVMPQCTPTRVALMTGRYPSRFGRSALAASNEPAFPKDTPTLAQMFKYQGYETFICGKWHLGSYPEHGPNHFGFDQSYGSMTGAVGMYDHRYRNGKFKNTWHRNHELIPGSENGTHATELVVSEAIRIVKGKRQKPFFLYLPLHSVHTPLDIRGPFVDSPTRLDPDNKERWLNENEIKWFHDPEGIIQREKDPEKRLLLAAVNHMDHCIGQVIEAINESGQRDQTLILFSSDNGPQGSWPGNAYPDDLKLSQFNQPLPMRGKKVDVWEGGVHVPAFANWPGQLEPGTIESPVHIVDWFATLASMLQFRPKHDMQWDGISLWDAMKNQKALPSRNLYFCYPNRWALRDGDWKIVKYRSGVPNKPADWQLFNLTDDPRESNNLNDGSEKMNRVVNRLHAQFLVHRSKDKVLASKPAK